VTRSASSESALDRVAFRCQNRAEGDEWARHLDELPVEHSEVNEVPSGAVLTFRDPDNI